VEEFRTEGLLLNTTKYGKFMLSIMKNRTILALEWKQAVENERHTTIVDSRQGN